MTELRKIQINEILPQEIFKGVDNVIHMKDTDGFIKYLTGSFSDKRKAIKLGAPIEGINTIIDIVKDKREGSDPFKNLG